MIVQSYVLSLQIRRVKLTTAFFSKDNATQSIFLSYITTYDMI